MPLEELYEVQNIMTRIIRATMTERSYKNNMMKRNLFVQVVILNIEFFNLFVRCILLLH